MEERFVDNGNGTVTDRKTKLMWMKDDSYIIYQRFLIFSIAKKFVDKMNAESFGGYSDWRIPSKEEAHSLYYREKEKHWQVVTKPKLPDYGNLITSFAVAERNGQTVARNRNGGDPGRFVNYEAVGSAHLHTLQHDPALTTIGSLDRCLPLLAACLGCTQQLPLQIDLDYDAFQ